MIAPDPVKFDGSPEYMRMLRLSSGLTQEDWRRRLGVSDKTVRRYETVGGYSYADQYTAEGVVRHTECEGIAVAARALGADERGVLLAQTLYLSGRAEASRAVDRGVEYSVTLRQMGRTVS